MSAKYSKLLNLIDMYTREYTVRHIHSGLRKRLNCHQNFAEKLNIMSQRAAADGIKLITNNYCSNQKFTYIM